MKNIEKQAIPYFGPMLIHGNLIEMILKLSGFTLFIETSEPFSNFEPISMYELV